MSEEEIEINWEEMLHELTPDQEKYLHLLIETGGAKTPLELLVRQEKFVRKIYEDVQKKSQIELDQLKEENKRLRNLLNTVDCQCSVEEKLNGHTTGCFMPEFLYSLGRRK